MSRCVVPNVLMAKTEPEDDGDLHLVTILDTGCMQSVVGEEMVKRWCADGETVRRKEKSSTVFAFGDGRNVKSLYKVFLLVTEPALSLSLKPKMLQVQCLEQQVMLP